MALASNILQAARRDTARDDYGDWQTRYEFAKEVCLYLKSQGLSPEVIVEPTCGIGNFIVAAIDVFDSVRKVYAVEINGAYAERTARILAELKSCCRIDDYELCHTSVFGFDFSKIASANQNKNVLVIGNPPWVTNSGMGKTAGSNLPVKSNINKARELRR